MRQPSRQTRDSYRLISPWRGLDIREGRTDPAKQRLTAITQADPKNVAALLVLANLEENAGNQPGAAARYRAVLDVDGSNLLALNNLAYSLATSDPDEASKLAQRAVELAPDSAAVQDTLGWVYYRRANFTMALPYLQAAVAREGTPRREFHLAVCYLKSGDKELGAEAPAKSAAAGSEATDNGTGLVSPFASGDRRTDSLHQ